MSVKCTHEVKVKATKKKQQKTDRKWRKLHVPCDWIENMQWIQKEWREWKRESARKWKNLSSNINYFPKNSQTLDKRIEKCIESVHISDVFKIHLRFMPELEYKSSAVLHYLPFSWAIKPKIHTHTQWLGVCDATVILMLFV